MNIIEEIKVAWGWVGIEPIEVIGENDFGNLMIKDINDQYWRLCPEDLYCEVIAQNREELDKLSTEQEFLEDWYMQGLVDVAQQELGSLTNDLKYHLVTPPLLGGEYAISNINIAPLHELIRFSGDLANQIKDLPEGAEIKIEVVD